MGALLLLSLLAIAPPSSAYWDGVNDMPPSGRNDVDSDGDDMSDAEDDDDDNDGILDDHDDDDDGDGILDNDEDDDGDACRMMRMTMMIMTASLMEKRTMTVMVLRTT